MCETGGGRGGKRALFAEIELGEKGGGIKDKRARAHATRTWPHLTRSYFPLNIGSDVDVHGRRRRTKRRLNRRSTLISRRAVQSA